MDVYYTGSTVKASADFNYGAITTGNLHSGSLDATYRINSVGTDIGFIKELNDISSLGFIFNFNREDSNGDGSFIHTETVWGGTGFGIIYGSLDADASSNTFALSVLYGINLSDTLSLGAGVTYAYINRSLNYEENATGAFDVVNPENVSIDKEMTFDYHLISPVFGISIQPIDALVINSSVTPRIYVGSVDKVSRLFNDFTDLYAPFMGIGRTYTENLDSNDLFVLDFDYMLDGEYDVIPERLSIPFFFNFTYGVAKWSVDGVGSGYYSSANHYAPFQGPGPIAYENKTEHWTISVGGGVNYTIGGYDLSALMGYSRINLKNSYSMENDVVSSISFWPGTTIGGLSVFHHTVEETRDIFSLKLGVSREFTENFSIDFSARYDIGWGHMGTDTYCTSQFEYRNGIGAIDISLSDKEVYHDLTLSTYLAYSPIENLSLSLGGMVKIPLSGLDYDLGGDSNYTNPTSFFWHWDFSGASTKDISCRSWDYGGTFNVEYAF